MKNKWFFTGMLGFILVFGLILAGCGDDGGTVSSYTVTYNANGGSGTVPGSQTVETGTIITVAGQGGLSYSGMNFNGWNTSTNGSGTAYAAGSSLTVNADTTLYAQWTTGGNDGGTNPFIGAWFSDYGEITITATTINLFGVNPYTRTGNTIAFVDEYDEEWTGTVSGNTLTLMLGDWELIFTKQGSGDNPGGGTTVPSIPTGVSATAASSSSITVSWTAVSDATGYIVQRSTSASGTFTQIGSPTSASFTDTELTASTSYWYRVIAQNSAGQSQPSMSASATTQSGGGGTTVPSVPTGVSATAASSSSITVSWTAVSGATGYIVQRSTSASGTFTQVGSPTSASFTDTGLTASTSYWYRVIAQNSAGQSQPSTSASATTQAPSVTVPSAPSWVDAFAASSSSINVSWQAVSGATGYIVQRSTSASGTYTQVGTPTTNSFTNTGLSASTTYWYRVAATNSAGNSSWSSTTSAATQAPAPTIPSAPTGVTATAASSSSITVSWSAVTGATSYRVEVRTTSTGTWSTLQTVFGTSYTHTGLSANTQRWYRVFAINTAGTSSASSIVTATTSQAAFGLQEAHSAFLLAGGSSYSSVFPVGNFTWTASSNTLSYTSSPPGSGSSGVRGFEATSGSPASMLFYIEMEVVFNASRQITTVRHRYVITFASGITGLNPSSPTSTNPHRTAWYNNPTVADSIAVPGIVLNRTINQTTTLPFISGTWRRTN